MRQVGFIEDFGYELVERSGPSHQPTFVVAAWAQKSGGDRVQTDKVSAAAKKSAERQAAQLLVDVLAGG
jgi:dsRNA-specific ribonuclease